MAWNNRRGNLLNRKHSEVGRTWPVSGREEKLTMANGQHWRHRKSQIGCGLVGLSRTLNLAAGEEGMSMLSEGMTVAEANTVRWI